MFNIEIGRSIIILQFFLYGLLFLIILPVALYIDALVLVGVIEGVALSLTDITNLILLFLPALASMNIYVILYVLGLVVILRTKNVEKKKQMTKAIGLSLLAVLVSSAWGFLSGTIFP